MEQALGILAALLVSLTLFSCASDTKPDSNDPKESTLSETSSNGKILKFFGCIKLTNSGQPIIIYRKRTETPPSLFLGRKHTIHIGLIC